MKTINCFEKNNHERNPDISNLKIFEKLIQESKDNYPACGFYYKVLKDVQDRQCRSRKEIIGYCRGRIAKWQMIIQCSKFENEEHERGREEIDLYNKIIDKIIIDEHN